MENPNIKKTENGTKYVLRGDNWTDDHIYEAKLKVKLAFGPPPYVLKKSDRYDRWIANQHLMKRGENGDIQYIICSKCSNSLPYHHFYADYNGNSFGRASACKSCFKVNKKPQSGKQKNASQFATNHVVKIRRSLHLANGQYVDLHAKQIWAALGYSKEDLIAHFQGLMEPWMNWKNNITPKAGQLGWQVDHIKPLSAFTYKSITDPQFVECWSLANLRPLEAKANIAKSNK